MRLAVVAARPTQTNLGFARVVRAGLRVEALTPAQAVERLSRGDVAVGRLDVLPTLDGIDDGLWALGALAARGVTVLNPAEALIAAHDKLVTAWILRHAGLPHPETSMVRGDRPEPQLEPPVVVKPRFGSWGRDVTRCDDANALRAELERIKDFPWYRRHGALVQELVPPRGHDMRIVVAGDRAIGAVSRVAAPGEWRTNVALGATRRPVVPPPDAVRTALAAARASSAALVGVDLLPTAAGRWTVIELNGAVEFTPEYARGRDVFVDACLALCRAARRRPRRAPAPAAAA
ncbi:MAG TPA: hypothetical protein VH572_01355 [Gaiella sp.]|jgi:RimK family alpha-L-glutamate ligase